MGLFGGNRGGASSSAPDRKNAPGSVDVSRSTAYFTQQAGLRRGRASSILASGLALLGRSRLGQ